MELKREGDSLMLGVYISEEDPNYQRVIRRASSGRYELARLIDVGDKLGVIHLLSRRRS